MILIIKFIHFLHWWMFTNYFTLTNNFLKTKTLFQKKKKRKQNNYFETSWRTYEEQQSENIDDLLKHVLNNKHIYFSNMKLN